MAAGPEAVEKRTAVMGEFAKLIEENAASELDSRGSVPAMHAQTVVAGAYEAVYRMIAAGETGKLLTLLPDLESSRQLPPYVGRTRPPPRGARSSRRRPPPRRRPGGVAGPTVPSGKKRAKKALFAYTCRKAGLSQFLP